MVLQNPKSEEQWGYWINFPELISKQQKPSIKQEDINKRMNMMVVAPSCSKNSIF